MHLSAVSAAAQQRPRPQILEGAGIARHLIVDELAGGGAFEPQDREQGDFDAVHVR
jgi:hypothetical protein